LKTPQRALFIYCRPLCAFNFSGGLHHAHRTQFPRDLFADLERLQREMQQTFDLSPNIRGLRGCPAARNVGGTPKSVKIYAFTPDIDPASLEVQIEKGVLKLRILKAEHAQPRKIEVKVA